MFFESVVFFKALSKKKDIWRTLYNIACACICSKVKGYFYNIFTCMYELNHSNIFKSQESVLVLDATPIIKIICFVFSVAIHATMSCLHDIFSDSLWK